MDFTGERLIPDQQRDDDLYHEHIVRYQLAAQWARGRRVLDAGCGAGYGAAALAAAGAHSVLGIDIAAEAIDYARAHYQQPGLSFAVADISAWDEDSGFDLIVSFEVIEHLDDPATLVRAAERLLARRGLFLVSTPNAVTYPPGNPFHKHEMALDAFSTLLSQVFPAVTMFEQDYRTALAVRPQSHAAASAWSFTPVAAPPARPPDYYIALCAKKPATLASALCAAKCIMYELPADRLGERIGAARTLQTLLDEKNRILTEKDTHIAHLEAELQRQGEWAAGLEQQVKALGKPWKPPLLGWRPGRR